MESLPELLPSNWDYEVADWFYNFKDDFLSSYSFYWGDFAAGEFSMEDLFLSPTSKLFLDDYPYCCG